MAKRVLFNYYTFDPATKTITIPNKVIPQESMLLITNVTDNIVIFNFSDPDLKATTYTTPYSSTGTQIVLNYNTSGMSSSDVLSILVDEADVIVPDETLLDPTNKMRVSTPQSLIDTDFEYGLQPIKWESYNSIQNYPGYYLKGGGNSFPIFSLTFNNFAPRSTGLLITTVPHNLNTGDLINISYSNNYLSEGTFPILNVIGLTSCVIQAKGQINGSVYTSAMTVQGGSIYDSANNPTRIQFNTITSDNAPGAGTGSTITVNTLGKHGLLPGSPILVNSSLTTSANGVWYVYDVPSTTSFRYQTPGFSTQTSTVTSVGTFICVRPEANFVHRPSDGGVMISTTTLQEGISAVRQSRRYFRYQSGKGLQMSTGTKFTPHLDINTVSSSGTSCTMIMQQAMGIQSGVTIVVEGVETNVGAVNPYNGTFTVTEVIGSSNLLRFNMTTSTTDTSPGGITPQATVKNWKGAAIRVGMFDMQNGFYFEYDGETMFAVRRNSVRELMGTVTATTGATAIVGTGTKFSKQLVAGDYVVIKGQSYQVTAVDSDTSINVAPPFRGATVSGARMNLTQNIRTPQSQWNLDRCDGTGPSGYSLDLTKMQMCYIDYTWYGAGFIRFGFRATDGNVVYVHKVANNNVNNQAYMRSGNLPVRYEVTNIGPYTKLLSGSNATTGATVTSGSVTFTVKDAEYWPSSGGFTIQQDSKFEVCTYSGKTQNNTIGGWDLTGISRRQFGGDTSNLTYTVTEFDGGSAGASSQATLTYIGTTCAPNVMHWGTSVIMDGGYNDDRSIVFAYARQGILTVNANTSVAVLSIRLAPSVDNSVTGQFSTREIVNRMQLQIKSMGLVASTSVQVLGVLNAGFPASATKPNFPDSWTTTSVVSTIGSGSLAQIIDHSSNTTIISGGEQIFGFVTGAAGDTYDLGAVRDLGTSVISGDGSNRTPGYPNGPDILTIVLRNATAGAVQITNLRLSWTEAQA